MGPEEYHNDPSARNDRDRSESQQPHDPRPSMEEIEKAGEAGERGEINSFAIVGIGASAGGLDAMNQLLQALPVDTGMAFVLVQHLDPTHESHLAEILSRSTAMPITEVRDEPVIEPNHVYVIPPDRNMTVAGGRLKLYPREEGRGRHHTVDAFLRGLAEDQGHRAIAVILSGSGNDGTMGTEAIKADGGITFAQDETAAHQGMPRSAIAAGCVDFVLPPPKIAAELVRISRHPYVVPARVSQDALAETNINKILRLLHEATGVDFTHYKSTTLYRRITRRMLLHNLEGLAQYFEFLQNDLSEVQALYQDILISVTSFFRDPEAFEFLKKEALPKLLADRPRNQALRVWVLGCSTGEEAYSIAMLLAEANGENGGLVPAQVFATDLNEQGIERARAGTYSKTIAQDLSPERLRRFFVETERGYQVAKSIREMCVFARQNVLTDPPFSRLDLISCRNLLIYMQPELQQRIMSLFQYALKPRGYLWLGTSETVGAFSDRFDAASPRHKLFVKKSDSSSPDLPLPVSPRDWEAAGIERVKRHRPAEGGLDALREADRLALIRYAPPGVVVNANWEILQFRGDTSPFLAPAPGRPNLNALSMAREGLLLPLRTALQEASGKGQPVRHDGLRVKSNGGFREINLEVIPLRDAPVEGRCYLVLFEPIGEPPPHRASESHDSGGGGQPGQPAEMQAEVDRLFRELESTRDYLQSLIEQRDAANEELQSANEEVQSSNEELQSINEELQTTKEEIQSSNEELTTVNEELRDRNEQLSRYNNDLTNFLASTHLALVMLGPDLRIRRFSPQAERLLNLIASDIGRPIDDLKLPLNTPDLDTLLHEVIDDVVVKEIDVQDKHGRWYSLRLRPYKTIDNRIDGVVLVLVDMDAQKRVEQQLRITDERYRLLMEGAEGIAIILLDDEGRVTAWNVGAQRIFGYTESEIVGQDFAVFFLEEDAAAGRPERELASAREGRPVDDDNWLKRKDGSRFWAAGAATALRADGDHPCGYAKVVRDVTEPRKTAAALYESEARFQALFERADVGIKQVGQDGRVMLVNDFLCNLLGYSRAEIEYTDYTALVHPDDRRADAEQTRKLFSGEVDTFTVTKRYLRKDGSIVWALCTSAAVRDATGQPRYRLSVVQDITARKAAEDALARADRRKDEFLAMLAHELRNPLAPLQATLELMRVNPDPAVLENSRPIMERQVEKLTRLVDDLLDAARITQGKIELKREPVDLLPILLDAVESTERQIETAGHQLSVSLPHDALYVDGDAVRLEQVFTNLLTNAARYTDRGGRIELSMEQRGEEAVVRVKDNGIGIAVDVLPHVFELFVQADRSPARERGGLGIGLSIVKQLVTMHAGRVEAHSAGRGKGSEFVVILPLLPADKVRAAEEAKRARNLPSGDAPSRRVLVVDDNVDAAASLSKLLKLQGHEIRVAHAGPAALESAADFSPEVVLLDIGLPGMDGYEVATEMRKRPQNQGVLLVALSGYGQDEDRARSKAAGFDEHFVKPVNLKDLQTLLANHRPG